MLSAVLVKPGNLSRVWVLTGAALVAVASTGVWWLARRVRPG